MHDKEDKIWTIICSVVTLLLAGNTYFIKHSLDRLDSIETMVWSLRQEIAVLNATVSRTSHNQSCLQSPHILSAAIKSQLLQ